MKQLYVVSTGPGDPNLLAPQAKMAINDATDLVAYGLYLELLGDDIRNKTQHDLPLGQEIERARLSLNLAASGKTTALISSGDIGIFAMATLVFELLDRAEQGLENNPEWFDIDIQVIPGISAMQAAASRVGATLGHDFCAISLSDLLTPWETIETRIHAAASADFVISFYNPVSKKRRWQLDKAKHIILQHRDPNTPVVLGKNLTRADEHIRIITLEQLEVDDVDMLTLVQIGSSHTKHIKIGNHDWVYTPRGYQKKMTQETTT
ncbi:MAG: precorrin-3B C(17)-methyltransferase [Methylococcales bacterium]|jgi:precorrin-3B C17-methyltransferase|nr:precorrin-3B C(17)-methyltransferase [Methylococcales bacterium]MBT7442413.1 precorrin-3B C(17)-methyltransferase [Methylococcales bacterium]